MQKNNFIEKEILNFKEQMDPECEEQKEIKGTDKIPTKLNIVGVKYEDKFEKKTFSGREYSYYTEIDLEIGDIVEVPTRYGTAVAMVTRVNISEKEIENIKDFMKIVEKKIDKREE